MVGSCSIQLCVASGLTVLTTVSSKNRDYVKELGAHYVFDHAEDNVGKQLNDPVAGKVVVGAYDTISIKDIEFKCAEFLHAVGGGILFATRPSEFAPEEILLNNVSGIAGKSSLFRKVDRLLIRIGHPPGSFDGGERPLWMKIWVNFMGERLETGNFRAKPETVVVEGGFEKLQDAMDLYRKGISAAKMIVLL
jgi:NADPH:quinone reductase-like Zn-dependent oxidoreductase